MKLHKGDQIKITSGKDRGKTGTILRALPDEDRILVDGLNLFNKRSRPKRQGEKGQTVAVPRPLPASRVMLICSVCKEPTRVGFRVEGNAKVRYCKKCKANT
ncbi:MAG: 50S ribosomal protein L24 [Patescibacteria group bacterium]|nr:50S ribosomal protein L24 [Patescibacteria group bacterium]